MLFVLGAGSYSPAQQLSDSILAQLGLDPALNKSGVSDRRTTLNLEVLLQRKNIDLQEALQSTAESTTDMGERAARIAIERAGIAVADIGLVVADCVTPIEVTPAESQRVACRLGLKVPAYDIYSTSGICPAQFWVLSNWKKERVPKYVLCVSTNAPTQRVEYGGAPQAAWRFGDGASACVVSIEDQRGLELLSCDYQVESLGSATFDLDTLGYIVSHLPQAATVTKHAAAALAQVKKYKPDILSWSYSDLAQQQELIKAHDLTASKLVNSYAMRGDMVGSNSLYMLGENWSTFVPGMHVAVVVADGGVNYGSAVFAVRGGA